MSLHSINIDVTKLDKSAFYKGAKGTYVALTIMIHDAADQYGNDSMVTQDLGKERREAGERGAIVGNGKWIVKAASKTASAAAAADLDQGDDDDDDPLPF